MEGGFAQAGHGRKDLLSRLSKGDRIVYYSSKDTFENGPTIQKFTALGKVLDEEPYEATGTKSFKPFRRNVDYKKISEAEIRQPCIN